MDDAERLERLKRSLTNHRPSEAGIQDIEAIRETALVLGEAIISMTPDGRERALALTHLEDCTMWAVKAVALATGEPVPIGG